MGYTRDEAAAFLRSMASSEQYFECNEPSVIFERFADETILINLDVGHYYSMDPAGAVIWDLLHRAFPVDRIAAVLSTRYAAGGDDVGEAVRAFVARLHEEGLIRPRREIPPSVISDVDVSIAPGETFRPPVLSKYDDMEQMLLLDPVHDVAETGWPAPSGTTAERAVTRIEEDDDVSSWPSLDDES